jgi:hypothetical protein
MGSLPFHNPAAWCAAIAMLALAAILACFIFYLITRLRFAFFHCLVTRTSEIRSGWFLYRDQAARFFWLNLAVGFCFLLVMGLTALPFVNGFMRLFHENQQSGRMDFGLLLSLVLPLIPIMLLFVVAGVLTDLVLRDGMMPHYALEDASAGEAWSQVWAHVRAEKRQFIAYALLRLVLPFLAMVAIFFLLLLPGLALAGSVAAAELGIHSVFAGSSGASALVGVLVQVLACRRRAWRTGQHRRAGVCAGILRRALPSAGRDAVPGSFPPSMTKDLFDSRPGSPVPSPATRSRLLEDANRRAGELARQSA